MADLSKPMRAVRLTLKLDADDMLQQVAAELRRLAGVEAENDALKQTLHELLRLRELGGARSDEPFTTFIERVIAERDALLAALRDLVQLEADGRTEYESAIPHWDAARAAIAKAEKGGGNG